MENEAESRDQAAVECWNVGMLRDQQSNSPGKVALYIHGHYTR